MRKDRRTKEGYHLRVLIDALKTVKAMSQEEWIYQWVKGARVDTEYLPQSTWIMQLEKWIIAEADKMLIMEAA